MPGPHSSFKFPTFNNIKVKWAIFISNVTQSFEIPFFVPDLDTLATTATKNVRSSQLRNFLDEVLFKAKMFFFNNHDELKFQSFKMVATISKASPTYVPFFLHWTVQ